MQHQAANLLAQKVTRELYRIAQAYGKRHSHRFEDLAHDLGMMLGWDNLRSVSLKFYRPGRRREVLVEYNYALHAGRPQFHLDDAQGLGIVPLRPPFEMSLVIQRGSQGGRGGLVGERRLRLNWHNAPRYARQGGYEHQDGNTTRRTGGRASKRVYMDDALRRRGQVKFYLPDRQYGFVLSSDGVDVFFTGKDAAGFQPRKGQRVSYLPIATPRGIQAKDLHPA